MHTPHIHVHEARKSAAAGASLLRMSALGRIAIAAGLSAIIWLLVYFAAT
ncbi:MAG: hypothetical protein KF794_13015 [Xanthobacteraceae bacterium]|nr:hypothetical protein [Xanthobacteraceae bacterium]QYK44673.1 MAG: hypothetical protein KF794_13015 [Xanthobacteraceae bacterium]